MKKLPLKARAKKALYVGRQYVRLQHGKFLEHDCLRITFYEEAVKELGLNTNGKAKAKLSFFEDKGNYFIQKDELGNLTPQKINETTFTLPSIQLFKFMDVRAGDYELFKFEDKYMLKPILL